MISQKEAIAILEKNETFTQEHCDVLRRYIFDVKQIDVGQINNPNKHHRIVLLQIAIEKAKSYYLLKQ